MSSKLLGGILLVIGTTIGAGMLALPVATAELGFWGSIVQLVSCWGLMTLCALLFLEVNLWFPRNSNLISMVGGTLGWGGQAISWVFYLLLLYSIICAYIAGGGDLFHYLLLTSGIKISTAYASILFTFLFGAIVYCGIRVVDYVNRGLMLGKMGAFILLVLFILPFISMNNLDAGSIKYITSPNSLTITAVAFGSLMIIPSLRSYFEDDVTLLRKAIIIGFTIPLFCYIAWDMVIMGVVPLDGDIGLKHILASSSSNSDLVSALQTILQQKYVTAIVKFFTSICMATSFLSISLSLSDFLADGFNIDKKGWGNIIVYTVTFIPPLIVVIFYPDAFIRSLNFAGLSCFILMVLLPALMVWLGRYTLNFGETAYKVGGGKSLLILVMVFATLLIGFGVEQAIV